MISAYLFIQSLCILLKPRAHFNINQLVCNALQFKTSSCLMTNLHDINTTCSSNVFYDI